MTPAQYLFGTERGVTYDGGALVPPIGVWLTPPAAPTPVAVAQIKAAVVGLQACCPLTGRALDVEEWAFALRRARPAVVLVADVTLILGRAPFYLDAWGLDFAVWGGTVVAGHPKVDVGVNGGTCPAPPEAFRTCAALVEATLDLPTRWNAVLAEARAYRAEVVRQGGVLIEDLSMAATVFRWPEGAAPPRDATCRDGLWTVWHG